ncbi:hypothetical protein [Winogradskyella immobilis]|uniref:Uncharacterized protein n=1 Tax=Winogradskyella immobilis TaxID=2816852 RepID=A0ABS8EKC4_9FLAO|nr:hypothetical protein [Winogradskyella immobilis]MCC1483670.1 hypothetical protein [Winogradskyella immobilis]MCG0015764.1 hypothetical protein [Winogradskyella immobilis]
MAKIKGLITSTEAKKLNDEWGETRAEAMNQCISDVTGGKVTEDNRSSWWSLEDLKAYIKHAKKQAKKLGYEMNGIRVYCGAHSEDDCYATSFIVPTYAGGLGKDDGDGDNGDIPGGDGLNKGPEGDPPGSGYPQ